MLTYKPTRGYLFKLEREGHCSPFSSPLGIKMAVLQHNCRARVLNLLLGMEDVSGLPWSRDFFAVSV